MLATIDRFKNYWSIYVEKRGQVVGLGVLLSSVEMKLMRAHPFISGGYSEVVIASRDLCFKIYWEILRKAAGP